MLGASPLLKSPLMTDTAANPEPGLIRINVFPGLKGRGFPQLDGHVRPRN